MLLIADWPITSYNEDGMKALHLRSEEGGVGMRLDGMYSDVESAKLAVVRLTGQGYIQEDLTVVVNLENQEKVASKFDVELAVSEREIKKKTSVMDFIKQVMSLDENYVRGEGTSFKLPSRDHKDVMKGKIGVYINTDAENPVKRILDSLKS